MAEPRETHQKNPAGKLTRRQLAAAVSAVSASAVLFAQPPAAAPLPQNPDEELKAARDQNRQNAEQLDKFPLPMTTESAAHFEA